MIALYAVPRDKRKNRPLLMPLYTRGMSRKKPIAHRRIPRNRAKRDLWTLYNNSKCVRHQKEEGGEWQEDSIRNGLFRLGWEFTPLTDINAGNGSNIEKLLGASPPHKGTATREGNALRDMAASSAGDVWITFHASSLWWCTLSEGPVEEDVISKLRRSLCIGKILRRWSTCSFGRRAGGG